MSGYANAAADDRRSGEIPAASKMARMGRTGQSLDGRRRARADASRGRRRWQQPGGLSDRTRRLHPR